MVRYYEIFSDNKIPKFLKVVQFKTKATSGYVVSDQLNSLLNLFRMGKTVKNYLLA